VNTPRRRASGLLELDAVAEGVIDSGDHRATSKISLYKDN
jgi:hypothetical protein